MAGADPNEMMCLISKGLYITLSDILGPECIVKLRRQRYDIYDDFVSCDKSNTLIYITSGSRAEGFEFQSSDLDVMFIDKTVIVLNSDLYDKSNSTDIPTVLLMETENSPPGFTLLRCLRYDMRNRTLYGSLVLRDTSVYVSSLMAREYHLKSGRTTIHGPCVSGLMFGHEYDSAYTLKCPFWPKQAEPFVHRSLRNGWPSFDCLTDICKNGFLLVPINSKQASSDLIDMEWRISFSLAEKKLVYSMNHSQFLCYGLMKVLLNDILKKIPETRDILCSYYLKTAVFWEISESVNEWSPLNFIHKFWNTFRRVIKWVYIRYCPNFFIPQNNMFNGKLYGRQHRDLMLRLRLLYDEGYLCLLRCTSFGTMYSIVIRQPFVCNSLPTNADCFVPLTIVERKRMSNIISNFITIFMKNEIIAMIRILCHTAALVPTSEEMTSAIKLRTNYILQRMALIFHSNHGISNQSQASNKMRYCFVKITKCILRRTRTFFCFDAIYHAVCSYINGDYYKTICIVGHINRKLQRQPYMYAWQLDAKMIIACRQENMQYETIVKTFVMDTYDYEPEISIEELYLESNANEQSGGACTVSIPPLVFLYFLLILSYTRLNETCARNVFTCELQTLLKEDDGYHINRMDKAISWEILGICQQLCGDIHDAYQSYINALNDKYNCFKQATISRICSLFPS